MLTSCTQIYPVVSFIFLLSSLLRNVLIEATFATSCTIVIGGIADAAPAKLSFPHTEYIYGEAPLPRRKKKKEAKCTRTDELKAKQTRG